MKNIINLIWNFIKNNKLWFIFSAIVIILILFFTVFGGSKNKTLETITVKRQTIKEEVSVTGNVKPLSDVSLAFERGGRLANIAVSVGRTVYAGQVLATVSNSDLQANLAQAQANLKIAELQLGSKTDKVDLDLSQARISLINTIKDSYTKADDALKNKIYSLFNEPARYNAKLIFTGDSFLQEEIENGRNNITDLLDTWYNSIGKIDNTSNFEIYYVEAKNNLTAVKGLLDKCAEAVNSLSPDSANATQTQIDTWKAGISLARTNIDLAITSLVNAQDQYQIANLAVENSETDLSIQTVSIDQARAGVNSAEAELAKTIIKSPINGAITKIDAESGEIVPANKNVISVISYGEYEVESFVPEADIAKVKINNKARTTLDAYGSEVVFETEVIKIDPAATVIDGVPTYKVTLKFIAKDDRIRSGMTANLDILTQEKQDVLAIPSRTIISENNQKFVNIINAGDNALPIKTEIRTGIRGIDGYVEILSGLKDGDLVVTNN